MLEIDYDQLRLRDGRRPFSRGTAPTHSASPKVFYLWVFLFALTALTVCVDAGIDDACQLALGISCAEFEEAYIKASNTDALDGFGVSVSLDDDTLAVGAFGEGSAATGVNRNQNDNSADGSGAVYVFARNNGVWSQQAYIKASNAEGRDSFGVSVSLDGDTLAVGAFGEDSAATGVNGNQNDNSADGSGAVYVFVRNNGVWSQQAYIKASNTERWDFFGASVSLDGDTLVVGARGEGSAATGVNGEQSDNSAFGSGAVYVFTRNNGVWSQQAYIKASNTDAFDSFGVSVSLDGDTLAVGAFGEGSAATGVNGAQGDNSANGSGTVYVFTRNNGVWSQQAYIKASNTDALDRFGISVSLDGDTLAVGATGEVSAATGVNGNQNDNSASGSILSSGSGAVYVFTRNNGVWSQQAYIKASNTDADDAFSASVSLDGDTLAVGAFGEDSAATGVNGNQNDNSADGSSAVYVFTRNNGVWSQQAYIKASNTDADDAFGASVSLDGDTLAVGALFEGSAATGVNGAQGDNSAMQSGAVYVRRIAP